MNFIYLKVHIYKLHEIFIFCRLINKNCYSTIENNIKRVCNISLKLKKVNKVKIKISHNLSILLAWRRIIFNQEIWYTKIDTFLNIQACFCISPKTSLPFIKITKISYASIKASYACCFCNFLESLVCPFFRIYAEKDFKIFQFLCFLIIFILMDLVFTFNIWFWRDFMSLRQWIKLRNIVKWYLWKNAWRLK